MKSYRYFLIFLSVLALSGCPQENPDLVNPPPQTETVYARFINFAGDEQPRTLVMEGGKAFTDVNFGQCTEGIHPPFDSVFVTIRKGNTEEIKTPRRVRFVRNSFYTFYLFPTAKNSEKPYNPADSLIYVPTTTGLSEEKNVAYIKVIDANPDSTVSYSLTFGCPNGSPIATNLQYRQYSFLSKIRSGQIGISILRHKGSEQVNLGLFKLNLKERTEYTIVIAPGVSGMEEGIFVLNDYDPSAGALQVAAPEEETEAYIRTVNLSSSPVQTRKEPDLQIESVSPNRIGDFKEVTACTSLFQDSISAYVGGHLKSAASKSLEVFNYYSLFVFDSLDGDANLSVLVEQLRFTPPAGKAYIRVINAAAGDRALTATVLARKDDSNLGFQNGIKLCDMLYYGRTGKIVEVDEGLMPLAIFTGGTPANLLFTTTAKVEKDKSYVMVISKIAGGNYRISMLEDDAVNQSISYYDESVYCSFVNLVAGPDFVEMSLKSDKNALKTLDGAKFYFATALTTIVRTGQNTLTIAGKEYSFNAELGKRVLIVASGKPDDLKFAFVQSDPMGTGLDSYRRRFVNASPDISALSVTLHYGNGDVLVHYLPFGTATEPTSVTLDRKISLVFFDSDRFVADKKDSLYKVSDIRLARGKNYSVIFGGIKGNYSAVIHQEY